MIADAFIATAAALAVVVTTPAVPPAPAPPAPIVEEAATDGLVGDNTETGDRLMAITYKCRHCGLTFERTWKSQVHCSLACRLWAKAEIVEGDRCWEWRGARADSGYGCITIRGTDGRKRNEKAHRVAYEVATNTTIPEGLQVCHSCDNPNCVNPAHLWLGTNTENVTDRSTKGRSAAARAKLTFEIAEQIREGYALKPESQAVIARRYGVAQQSINAIIRNKAWLRPRPTTSKESAT